MGYFWYDEDQHPEGLELQEVVSQELYDTVLAERDELINQRETLIERVEVAEEGWRQSRNRYADAFITTRDRIMEDQADDVWKDGQVQTFNELWRGRGEYGAY